MLFPYRSILLLLAVFSAAFLPGCDDDTGLTTPITLPTTHTVALDGNGTYEDLATAMAAAASGDTLLIAGGVYTGDRNVNLNFGNKSLTLIGSSNPATPVIIDAAQSGDIPIRLFTIAGGQDHETLIRYITFRNGNTGTGSSGEDGGAIVLEGSSPWFRDCRFENCTARRGGAVNSLGGSPRFQNCTFTNNTTSFGSMGYDDGGGSAVFVRIGAPLFLDCKFRGNQELGGDGVSKVHGGALVLMETEGSVICGCEFTNNSCGKSGGALGLKAASPTVSSCRFLNNTATDGGALAWDEGSTPKLVSCDFDSNRASNSGGALIARGSAPNGIRDCRFKNNTGAFDGGAILVNASLDIQNCLFQDNYASSAGGAIRINGDTVVATLVQCRFHQNQSSIGGAVAVMYYSTADIAYCTFTSNKGSTGGAINVFTGTMNVASSTFVGNHAWQAGSALAFPSGSGYENTVTHSILFENYNAEAVYSDGERVEFSCCTIHGHDEGNWTGGIAGQLGFEGNLEADPLFCDAAGFELFLEEESPCAGQDGTCGTMGASGVGCGDFLE